jgi:hypothetical protein
VILVCAAIYVLAATTARPGSAWIGFAASIPIIAVGRIADAPWLAVLLAGAAAIVLVVVGAVRGSWRAADRVRQLPALLLFAALALTALLVSPPWLAAGVAAVALVAHAGWDIAHHRRREVVSPAYAEFCAVLDLALAAVLIVLAVVRGGA